jgi:GAF domain-containing protein
VRLPPALLSVARTALSADAMFVDDILMDERIDEAARAVLAQRAVRSMGLLAVRNSQRVVGLLMVAGQAPHSFSVGEARLLRSLVGQMVVGLERVSLLNQAQERVRHERVLREIADKMRQATDMDALIRTTVQELSAALDTSDAFLQLATPPDWMEET